MADLTPAKSGTVLSARAVKKLAAHSAWPHLTSGATSPNTVHPKSEGKRGQWVCVDCGETPQSNFSAWSHADAHPKHRFAWLNSDACRLEEP